jgi:E3 Ubiquitin ligase
MPTLEFVGIGLLAVGILALIVWLTQSSKAGKIKSVPFKKPSEIAQGGMNAGDAKQMVSTEGQMNGQPIAAPMSGKPCVYYEVTVTRGFHKESKNAQGQTTKVHGTKSLLEQKVGSIFSLGDGAGTIGVDCSEAPSMDLTQSHRTRHNVGLVPLGRLQFGNMQLETESLVSNLAGMIVGGETTEYYEGVERIVPFVPGQTLYALGKLSQTKGGLAIGGASWSKLLLSDKGRDATLGDAAKTAKIAMIAGGALVVAGAVTTGIGFATASHTATTSTTSAETKAPAAKPAPPPASDHKKK